MRKSEVAPYVPTSLRESRYDMYVDNRESWAMAWDDRPLYLVDEWVAYTNGSAVGVDQVNHGLWSGGWRDGMMGTIEFTVYAFALAHAVSEKDPAYWASNTQFRAFMAWQAERAMSTYREGADMGSFRWDKQDAYYQRFLESPDAEGLRSFIRQTWGDAFFEQVIAGREVSETAELTVSEGTGEPISETPEPTVSEVDELSESEDVAVTDADDEDPVVDEAELEVDDDQPPRWHRRPGPPIPRDERPWPPPWLRIGVSIGVSDTMR